MDALSQWVESHTQWARRGRLQTLKFLLIYFVAAVVSVGALWLVLAFFGWVFGFSLNGSTTEF